MPLRELAVVVPIGPGERAWQGLLSQLTDLPPEARIVLVATTAADLPRRSDPVASALAAELVFLTAPCGRALQQNTGARSAERRWLWFLHADSRLAATTLSALAASLARISHQVPAASANRTPSLAVLASRSETREASNDRLRRSALRSARADARLTLSRRGPGEKCGLARTPNTLGYFDLRFAGDGPVGVHLNALGAFLRSRWLGLPFGDQGLFLARADFDRLGGFDPTLPNGEDHALVWAAHRAGMVVASAQAPIYTSARTYAERGWLRTTARHLWLTAAQAWRELRHASGAT